MSYSLQTRLQEGQLSTSGADLGKFKDVSGNLSLYTCGHSCSCLICFNTSDAETVKLQLCSVRLVAFTLSLAWTPVKA